MKSIKFKITILVLAFTFTGLMGCGSLEYPRAHHNEIDKNVHSFSYTADLRATHVIKKGDDYWVLTEPSPDAAFAYEDEESLSLDLSLLSIGKGGNGKEGMMSGREDLPLTGRAAYVLLARELCYRVNVMAFNTNASREQYENAMKRAFDVIKSVAILEAPNTDRQDFVHVTTGASTALTLTEEATDTQVETLSDAKEVTDNITKTLNLGTEEHD